MNKYPKLSLVIGEFGELSDDFSKLLHVLALFRAKEFNASDAQFLDDKEAYGACIWDFRRRLALESGKRICSIIKAGRKWIAGNRPEKCGYERNNELFRSFKGHEDAKDMRMSNFQDDNSADLVSST